MSVRILPPPEKYRAKIAISDPQNLYPSLKRGVMRMFGQTIKDEILVSTCHWRMSRRMAELIRLQINRRHELLFPGMSKPKRTMFGLPVVVSDKTPHPWIVLMSALRGRS